MDVSEGQEQLAENTSGLELDSDSMAQEVERIARSRIWYKPYSVLLHMVDQAVCHSWKVAAVQGH